MLASITNRPFSTALWYGPALVRRLDRLKSRLLVTVTVCAVCGVGGAASGAATPKASQQRIGALQRENATLAQRAHAAILDLYALDSKLDRAHAELASLGAQRERIVRERQAILMQLGVSRHNVRASQRQLALLVHRLYEQQSDDALAVVLGAESLEQAIATLDDLSSAARQHQEIATQSRDALDSLHASIHALAQKDAHLHVLEDAASRTAASLEATEGTRRDYLSSLAGQRQLNSVQISRINARAQTSAATGVAITPRIASAGVASPASGTITVVATGYSMSGSTATGVPAGWGTVAVDPSVIPLGSRLTIPGYGEGVAADTGSAVRGAVVDLWFPTPQLAFDWGRRVVAVTLN
jgi:3D (Asp-Asp-Asp) domain-containing protein/septal ring factor EnvC (AmiA/AmiB activator)